eukprot:TRINITY_DN15195_c0_g1_i1.p1 TRINITY_DN15195_c0_g1~~TRINITY_DN15195_c0_g1_i1.p1  ORF type:complete len:216 (-),score=40.25 TRINITY_DN15195_c0_g1_i1:481-1074(-)
MASTSLFAARSAGASRLPEDALKNTKLCNFYMRGMCQRGERCTFAHSQDTVLMKPDFEKTVMCGRWVRRGKCNKGAACKHAHGAHELRALRTGQKANNPQPQYQPAPTTTPSLVHAFASGSSISAYAEKISGTPSTSAALNSPTVSVASARDSLASPLSDFLIVKNTFFHIDEDVGDEDSCYGESRKRSKSMPPLGR